MPPLGGCAQFDAGSVYVLGDYRQDYMVHPDGTEIPQGDLVRWGATSYVDGKIRTPPIPYLCWFGVIRDGGS